MATKKGGVLTIPKEPQFPRTLTLPSSHLKVEIKAPDGSTQQVPMAYTFKKGVPIRIDDEQDFQYLAAMMWPERGKWREPLFLQGVPKEDPKVTENEVLRSRVAHLTEMYKVLAEKVGIEDIEEQIVPTPEDL